MSTIATYDKYNKPAGYEQVTVADATSDEEIRNGDLVTVKNSVAEQTGQWNFTFEADGGTENFAEGDTVTVAGKEYTATEESAGTDEFLYGASLTDAVGNLRTLLDTEDRFDASGTENEIILDESAGQATGESVEVVVSADDVKLTEAGVTEETESIAESRGKYEITFTTLYRENESVIFKGDGFTNARVSFDGTGAGDLEVDVNDFTDTDGMATQIATALNTQTGAGEISENQTITVEDSTITIKEDAGEADGNDIEVEDKLDYFELTRPTDAEKAVLSIENHSVRIRDDGERPTPTVGFLLKTAGTEVAPHIVLPSKESIDGLKVIKNDGAEGDVTLNVLYYKH